MVNQELLNEVRDLLMSGELATLNDVFKLLEVYKQLSEESDGLKAELEDMDMLRMNFLCEITLSDTDTKIWMSFKNGRIEFGEGDASNPTLSFSTTKEKFIDIIFGVIEISSAHESGDVTFSGGSEALMDLQAITSVFNEYIKYN